MINGAQPLHSAPEGRIEIFHFDQFITTFYYERVLYIQTFHTCIYKKNIK